MKKFYKIKSLEEKSAKEIWDKAKSEGYEGLSIDVPLSLKQEEKEDGEKDNLFHATFSTDSVDRHGESVLQNWKLTFFKKNPVYLDSHNYDSIEYIIGRVEKIKVEDNKLVGDIVFALENPRGKLAFDLAAGGFLNTSSVGFIPLEFDKDGNILDSELLEVSGVSVPAQPEALYERKQKDANNQEGQEEAESTEGGEEDDKSGETEGEGSDDTRDSGENQEGQEKTIEKQSSTDLIAKAVKKEVDITKRSLDRILSAITLVSNDYKGRSTHKSENAEIKGKINKAVKELLKMKKN